jgi:hypothetical protein
MNNIKEKLKKLARNPLTDCIENDALKYIEHLERQVTELKKLVNLNPNSVEFMDAFDQGFMAALGDVANDLEKYADRSKKRITDYRKSTGNMPTGVAQDQRRADGEDIYGA